MSGFYRKSDRSHQQYRTQDGIHVPGVTTIINMKDKPALVGWANKLGLDGIEVGKYTDSLANSGTLAHYKIQCDLTKIALNQEYLDEFSKVDHDRADTGFLKYLDWKAQHKIENVILAETPLVSEEHRFGGTLDFFLVINGMHTLVDVKTCRALYGRKDTKWTQLAAYHLLLVEHGYNPQEHYILRVGRNEEEGFEYAPMPGLNRHIDHFLALLRAYETDRELDRGAA